MKKIIISIILILTLCLFQPKLKAEIFQPNPSNNSLAVPLTRYTYFNVLKGITNNQELENTILYEIIIDSEEKVESGTISYEAKILYNFYTTYLKGKIEYNNGFSSAIFYLDEMEFYKFHKENDELIIDFSNELDFPDIFNLFVDEVQLLDYPEVDLELEYKDGYSSIDIKQYEFQYYGFSCIYAMSYISNSTYEDTDLYIYSEFDNPLTLDQIVDSIELKNMTLMENGIIIDKNDYILDENGKKDLSISTFRIVATDINGRVIVQKCYIEVIDGKGPTIKTENIAISYKEYITDEEIMSLCKITDSHLIYDVELNSDEYKNNYNIPGEYNVEIKAYDEFLNESKETIKITVIDEIPPIVVQKDIIRTTKDKLLTEDEIKKYLVVFDYGSGFSGKITINNMNEYKNNYQKSGVYTVSLTVYDNQNNSINFNVKIYVKDMAHPLIFSEKYTIAIPSGEEVTMSQIRDILIESGQITNKNAQIDSPYFETDDPFGDYNMDVTLDDGTIIQDTIIIDNGTNDSYETPVKDIKKDNTSLVIGSIFGILLLITIGILSVVVYKKRH